MGISDKNGFMNYYKFLIPALNTFSKTEANKSIKNGHKLIETQKIKTTKINKYLSKLNTKTCAYRNIYKNN